MKLQFDIQAWRGWDGEEGSPQLDAVPAMLRRRLSPLGRAAFSVALPLLQAFGTMPVVYASRHGEAQKTVDLLQSIAAEELLSPMAFSLSVHNAIAGLLSIQTKSHAPTVAIAAGSEDLFAALVEAAGISQSFNKPCLLLFCDCPIPEIYTPLIAADMPAYALAAVIGPGGSWLLQQQAGHAQGFLQSETHARSYLFLKQLQCNTANTELVSANAQWRLQQL